MIPPPNIPMQLVQSMPRAGMPVLPNMPRMVPPPGAMHGNRTSQPLTSSTSTPVTTSGGLKPPLLSAGGSDKEKAALIMQVLQLTDEQIAVLPAEQRQSILVLKEQIAKSAKR